MSILEVKQCFVLGNRVKSLGGLSSHEFEECLQRIKRAVVAASEPQLDLELAERQSAYEQRSWRYEAISIDETQIYDGAGELPPYMTRGTLRQVADAVARANLDRIHDCRAKFAIPGIMAQALLIRSERLLSVIVMPIGDPFRRKAPNIKWHIDDGSMRGISLAMSGEETLNAFIGTSVVRAIS